MIPELSSQVVVGAIIAPNNTPRINLADWEMGGIALEDPSQGSNVKPWKVAYVSGSGDITVEASDVAPTVVFNQAGIQWLSFCFDQNMRTVLAYTLASGVSYFRWYDAQAAGYVVTSLGSDVRTPQLTLDTKTEKSSASNDVLLTYLRSDKLMLRGQRERFLTEHVLVNGISASKRLINFGMSTKNRLQWEVQ